MAGARRRKARRSRWLPLLYIACILGSLGISVFLAARWNNSASSRGVLPVLSGVLVEGETRLKKRVEEIIRNFTPRQVMEKGIPVFGGTGEGRHIAGGIIGTGDVGTLLFALSDTDLLEPRTLLTEIIPCFSLPVVTRVSTVSEGISSRQAMDPASQPETLREALPEIHRDAPQGLPGDESPSEEEKDPDEGRRPTESQVKEPLVAIYHSHSSEAYRLTSGADHLWGSEEGVIHVGAKLASILEERHGIQVVHSKRIHDYPLWREAYTKAQKTILEILEANPSIEIVLDIHRDAGVSTSGSFATVDVHGVKAARVLIVVTSDRYGLPHPRWRENLAFAYQLNAKLDEACPGLSRGVSIRHDARWNQHVHPRAIILEIGCDKTRREEAEASTVYIADAISRALQDIGR